MGNKEDNKEMAEWMVEQSEKDVLITGVSDQFKDRSYGKGGDPEAERKRNDRAVVKASLENRRVDIPADEMSYKPQAGNQKFFNADIEAVENKDKNLEEMKESFANKEMAEWMVEQSEKDVLMTGVSDQFKDRNYGKGGDPEAERKRNDRAVVKASLEDRGVDIPADEVSYKPRVDIKKAAISSPITSTVKGDKKLSPPSPTGIARDHSIGSGFSK
jgi:hypothetical protein